jgi:hypothetical protein
VKGAVSCKGAEKRKTKDAKKAFMIFAIQSFPAVSSLRLSPFFSPRLCVKLFLAYSKADVPQSHSTHLEV